MQKRYHFSGGKACFTSYMQASRFVRHMQGLTGFSVMMHTSNSGCVVTWK